VVPDPEVREAILDRAREEVSPETISFLVRAYEDLAITNRYIEEVEQSPKWEDRARAAERLGRMGSPRAVPVLLRVIRDMKDEDEDVRGAALRALGRIRDPRALPGLIEALGFPEASLPPRIAEIIVMFGEDAVRKCAPKPPAGSARSATSVRWNGSWRCSCRTRFPMSARAWRSRWGQSATRR
jgi:HEAT repeat protein